MDFLPSLAGVAMDDVLRVAGLPAWFVCLGCLLPAVIRLLRGKGRYLDPIWGIVFLLALNRVSFLLRISAEVSHATAIALALVMGSGSLWYQMHDR